MRVCALLRHKPEVRITSASLCCEQLKLKKSNFLLPALCRHRIGDRNIGYSGLNKIADQGKEDLFEEVLLLRDMLMLERVTSQSSGSKILLAARQCEYGIMA